MVRKKEGSPSETIKRIAMEMFIAKLAHKSQMYVICCYDTYT